MVNPVGSAAGLPPKDPNAVEMHQIGRYTIDRSFRLDRLESDAVQTKYKSIRRPEYAVIVESCRQILPYPVVVPGLI